MKLIGIYHTTAQPPTKAHYQVYKRLRQLVGPDTFVITTSGEPTQNAPLNYGDKEQILVRHGVPANNIQKIQDWKHPDEIYHKYSSSHTKVIFALNQREADEISKRKDGGSQVKDSSGNEMNKQTPGLNELVTIPSPEQNKEVWIEGDGKLNYFQPYKGNENSMIPFEKHGYVMIIDDTKIEGKPVSTTNIRQVLGSSLYTDDGKKKFFRFVFGWFDVGLYTLISSKFKQGYQVASPDEQPSEETPVLSKVKNQPISQAMAPSTSFKENITKLVHEILKEIMDEDYSSTMSSTTGDSSSNGMAAALDKPQNSTEKASASAQKTKDLVQKEKEIELQSKQDKQQRDSYATTVKNYDSIKKKANRDSLDAVKKQIAQPDPNVASTPSTST